jgi:hypothetical protein
MGFAEINPSYGTEGDESRPYFVVFVPFVVNLFLLAHQPHVHCHRAVALGAHHDRIDFHVGEMIPVRGEDVGQADHRFHQRVDIARLLAAHAFEHFVAAQLFEHRARFALVNGEKPDRNVFQHFDQYAAEADHQERAVLRIGARADQHFGALHHFLDQ